MIDFLPTAEQQGLVDSVTDFLSNEMPIERLRPKSGSIQTPEQDDHWQQFAELGWFGIGLGESAGGIGLTLAEETLVFREFGRYLVSPALLCASIAARIAAAAGQPALCADIVEGRTRVALAHAIEGHADNYYLIDARAGDLLLVLSDDEAALFDGNSFANAESVTGTDGSLSLVRATRVAPTRLVSADPTIVASARVLIAAMLTGIAEATRDMAVNYVKLREQFGRIIGGFQAIKHYCADMAVNAEAAWCQTVHAALAASNARPDAAFHVAAAAIMAARAAIDNAEQNIQLHGGIGYTMECDAHLYLKRAHLLERIMGRLRASRTRLLAEPSPV